MTARSFLSVLACLRRQRRACSAFIALLLLVSPVTISAPIKLAQALLIVVGLVVTLAANAFLLATRARAARAAGADGWTWSTSCGQVSGCQVVRDDEVGRVVTAFNQMLDRLESERQQSGRRVLAAQEAERVGIARDLHDEVGQVLTGVLLHLDSIAVRRAGPSRETRRGEVVGPSSPRRGAPDLERAAPGDARASRPRQRADRVDDDVRPRLRHPGRAPVRPSAAAARARHRARRLPHRAREPDQRRSPRTGDARDDLARRRQPTASCCASPTTAMGSTASRRSTAGCAACASGHC